MPKSQPKRFTDENEARAFLERVQWPDGPICPHCGCVDRASRIKGGRAGLMFCNVCRMQFSVTVGTVFERSKVPLKTWLYATHLLCSSKKGISSQQLARMLGVTVKTAWFMSHRIRLAMKPDAYNEPPLGGDGIVVEADETELSPSRKSRPRARKDKLKFMSLVERDGRVRSRAITGAKGSIQAEVKTALREHVDPASTLQTDGAQHYLYNRVVDKHQAVNHDREFVRYSKDGDQIHVNTAEGYFSIFKRGLVGTYQHMSEQHLERYLAEFDFRMSHRIKLGYTDDMRTTKALEGITGKRLTYRRTNQAQDSRSDS